MDSNLRNLPHRPSPSIQGIDREDTRRRLATIAIGGFLGIVALIVGAALLGIPVRDATQLLTTVGGVLGGVVGAVVGFYFRSEE